MSQVSARCHQLRVLVQKLPEISRNILKRISTLLKKSSISATKSSTVFTKYFLRPDASMVIPDPFRAAVMKIFEEIVIHADFMNLETDDIPFEAGDFCLTAEAAFDYPGGEGQLSFKAGDKITLLRAWPDDWLEGHIGTGSPSFLPIGFVEIIQVPPIPATPARAPPVRAPIPAPAPTAPVLAPPQPPQVTSTTTIRGFSECFYSFAISTLQKTRYK